MQQRTPRVLTEDTGKIFEKAICLAYNVPYDGNFNYDLYEAEQLCNRLGGLRELFPYCTHTAARGARYDFTAINDANLHLSAKTTKKDGKIAPQVIGQPHPTKFCATLGIIPFETNEQLKQYIQENIVNILPVLLEHTLDCPTVYYNKHKDTIRYICLVKPIDWSLYNYSWTRHWSEWRNSTTLKISHPSNPTKKVSLLEMQFHSARSNMANRWFFEEFLDFFKDHLEIRQI